MEESLGRGLRKGQVAIERGQDGGMKLLYKTETLSQSKNDDLKDKTPWEGGKERIQFVGHKTKLVHSYQNTVGSKPQCSHYVSFVGIQMEGQEL